MIRIAIERVATAKVAKLPIARTILISVRHTSVFRSMQVESWGWNDIDVLPALTEVLIILYSIVIVKFRLLIIEKVY